jgi:hypothetical protein
MNQSKKRKMGPKGKYIPTKHPLDIVDILKKGGFMEDFCDKHDITERTFYYWIEKHPEFKEAYEKGLMKGKSKWINHPKRFMNNAHNHQYWNSVMKNRFGWNKHRFLIDPNAGPAKLVKQGLQLLSKGEINEFQFDRILAAADTKVRIKELTEYRKRLEHLESFLPNTQNDNTSTPS